MALTLFLRAIHILAGQTTKRPLLGTMIVALLMSCSLARPTEAASLTLDEDFRAPLFVDPYTAGRTVLLPDGKFLVFLNSDTLTDQRTGAITRHLPDGAIDPTFSFSRDYKSIGAVAPTPDGKLIIAAQQYAYGGATTDRILRLHQDGSIDSSFNLALVGSLSGDWRKIVLQPDGKILVIGFASAITENAGQQRIVRLLPDGEPDPTFGPVTLTTGYIYTLAVQPDQKILLAGNFQQTNGVANKGVARVNSDGSLDSSFAGTGFTRSGHPIRGIVILDDGKIVLGGGFQFGTGSAATRAPLVRLHPDGRADTAFTSVTSIATSPATRDLVAQSDGKLVGPVSNSIYRFHQDGTLDASFHSPILVDTTYSAAGHPGIAITVSLQPDGRFLLGGAFHDVDPPAGTLPDHSHFGVARLNSDGTLDPQFATRHKTGFEIAPSSFSQLADGSTLIGFEADSRTIAPAMPYNLGRLRADGSHEGNFSLAPANPTGFLLSDFVARGFQLLANGNFFVFGATGTSKSIYGKVRPDGTEDTSFTFDPTAPAFLKVRALPDGKVLLSPDTDVQSTLEGTLTRLRTDGALDETFQLATTIRTGQVLRDDYGYLQSIHAGSRVLAVQPDGKILLQYLASDELIHLVRLNPNGSPDQSFASTTFEPKNLVLSFPSLFDPVTQRPLQPPEGVYTADLPLLDAVVQADGRVVIVGLFTSFNGVAARGAVRLEANGEVDDTFVTGSGAQWTKTTETPDFFPIIERVALQNDGKLLIAGTFEAFNGTAAPGIASLNSDGSVETAFTAPAVRQKFATETTTLARQPDGSFLLSGSYSFPGETDSSFIRIRSLGGTPIVASPTLATAVAGQAFLYQIVASGQPTSYSATGLPPGFSLDPATGVISGQATRDSFGTYTIQLTATNADGTSSTQQLTLTVSRPAPIITSASTVSVSVGDSFAYQISATNRPTSYRAHNLPAGLSLDRVTGLITGIPTVLGNFEVALRAFNAAGSGAITLRLTIAGPPNDNFSDARAISGSMGTMRGANIGASKEPGEPLHEWDEGGKSVWYAWIAPSSGGFVFDTTGSSFDSLLGIYTGSSVNALTPVAGAHYGSGGASNSRILFRAVAGTIYRIAVDGNDHSYSQGTIVLNWKPGPPNDEFSNAQLISDTAGTATGSSLDATIEPGEPDHAARLGRKSLWYVWTAPSTRDVVFDTIGSSFDTLLAVYTGASVDGLAEIASNDNDYAIGGGKSRLSFTAIGGSTYRIAVAGWYSDGGNVTLNWQTGAIPYSFSTLAGIGPGSADGTGGAARFSAPQGVTADSAGNVYVADTKNHTIRKVTPEGVVTTLAGHAGRSGIADGRGALALFTSPRGLAVDQSGNVYVADGANTIRKITPDGVVSTIAGRPSHSGATDGTGTSVRFSAPKAVAVDRAGNLYVADSGNASIRKITPDGVVSTFASYSTPGNSVRFYDPSAIAVDADGNLYVADALAHTIRKLPPTGGAITLAGLEGNMGSADGTGSNARFASLQGLALDLAGNIYVSDFGSHYTTTGSGRTIRKVTTAGVVTTMAGLAGMQGSVDGAGSAARFRDAYHVAVDGTGNVYVADSGNHVIRKIASAREVSTVAGSASIGGNDGTAQEARFHSPTGLTIDNAGNVYVADYQNHTIRRINLTGTVQTVAGGTVGSADGIGSAAQFKNPTDVALDNAGNLYVADNGNHTIRKVTPAGTVSTIAGLAGSIGSNDGLGAAARFNHPHSVALDSARNVYVTDSLNHTIRKITPTGEVTTLAGRAGSSGNTDGVGAAARFSSPNGLVVDISGHVYVTDGWSPYAIRKITPAGSVTTLLATSNGIGLALDHEGKIYLAGAYGHFIRRINPSGESAVLGGLPGFSGNKDGPGGIARFNFPRDIAINSAGTIYVADTANNSIRIGVETQSPTIVNPLAASATKGQAFSYRISATGNPASFTASGLPAGLVVDTATGWITGTPSVAGGFDVSVSATNRDGTGRAILALTVSDLYADDGIDDAWQVQFFGHNNPNAQPNADPDGDGDRNKFEFVAGLDPTDPGSRFGVAIRDGAETPATAEIAFGPIVSERTYVVQMATDLAATGWAPLTSFTQSDNGSIRIVTDLDAADARKFYRVEITKP